MNRTIKITILLFFVTLICSANSGQNLFFGIGFEYGKLFNQINFNALPGIPRPNIPLTGESQFWNYRINANMVYRVGSFIQTGLRFDYANTPTYSYRDLESTLIGRDGIPEKAIIENTMNLKFDEIGGEPFVGFFINDILSLNFGLRFGYIYNSEFTQNQKVIQPADYGFNSPIGKYSGKIPQAVKMLYQTSVRLESESSILQLRNFKFKPEIQFLYSLNNMITGLNFKYYNITGGISISYINSPQPPIIRDTVIVRDTIEVLSGASSEKHTSLKSTISKSELIGRREITTLTQSHETIIPKTKPMLIGEVSAVFMFADKPETKRFNLEFEKTVIKFVYPAFSSQKGKIVFGKKLEIKTDSTATLLIPTVNFYPKVTAESGLKEWTLSISENYKELKRISGTLDIPSKIEWEPTNHFKNEEIIGKNFHYKLELEDFDSNKVTAATGSIDFNETGKNDILNTKIIQFVVIPADSKNFKQFIDHIEKASSGKKVKPYRVFTDSEFHPNAKLESELSKYGLIGTKSFKGIFNGIFSEFPVYNYYVIAVE